MYSKFLQVCFTLLWCQSAFSQVIENVRTRIEEDKIILQYDLKTAPTDAWIELKVFSSHNSFSKPLANISGAVAKVTPGANKQIEWQYGHELDNFNGDLAFELEAEVIFHMRFGTPKKSLRRGKENTIEWSGGRPQDSIHFEFISADKKVIWNKTALNKTGTLNLQPDPNLTLGKGYHLQLTSKDDKVTIPIQLKRKVARAWIISPAVIAIGTIVYLLLPDSKEGLPNAPEPPAGN